MEKKSSSLILLFSLVFLLISNFYGSVQLAEAGKRRIEISNDLDDVEDNEEDESWKEWGKKETTPEFDPPPDFSNMGFEEIQEEMAKRTFGPVVGFVKLRLGVRRTKDMVLEIAMKWSKVMRTGGIGVRFMAVDVSTLMFTMQTGKEVTELREFVLSQEEAYEVKIGKQEFRRPGDPPLGEAHEVKIKKQEIRRPGDHPLEDVVDKLQAKESKNEEEEDGDSNEKEDGDSNKDEDGDSNKDKDGDGNKDEL